MDNSLLFTLLSEALWRKDVTIPVELSSKKTEILFLLAEQQAVSGIVADALVRRNVKLPQNWVFKTVGLLEQIKWKSRVINEGAVKLEQLMSEANISYVIVKGQVVASYYLDPLLRQSGDIDYFCDALNFEVSQEVIKKNWGVEAKREDSELHVHFDYQEVTYEGHFSLTNLYNKRRNCYWKKIIANDIGTTVSISGQQIRTLSPTLHTLYVFIHLYSHLLALGVGLRQFCDLAVMLHYCKEHINLEVMREHLNALGLEKAYRACGSILVDQLGLKNEELGYSLTDSDRKYGMRVLRVVMYRGNMGHYNKRNGFCGVRHKMEAAGIKLSHFVKFLPLSPGYSVGWLCHEFRRNV